MNKFRIKLKQIIIVTLPQFYIISYPTTYYVEIVRKSSYIFTCCAVRLLNYLCLFYRPQTSLRGGRQITDPIEGITGILSGVATCVTHP